jgi:hypothetical protein
VPTPNEFQTKYQHQLQLDHQQQQQGQQEQQQQQQQPEDTNFLERAGQQFFSSFKSFGGFLSKKSSEEETNKLAEKKGVAEGSSKQNYIPIMVAGAAAVALGGLALFGTAPAVATVNSARNELVYQQRGERAEEALRSIEDGSQIYGEE